MRVGFIGLGIMGSGMARNLRRAGFELTVWNRTRARAEALVADGATVADSPAAVAATSDVVVLCVSDTAAVAEVLFGRDDTSSTPPQPAVPPAGSPPAAAGIAPAGPPSAAAGIAPSDAVVAGARPGTVVVDCSTISPSATRHFAEALRDRGLRFVDAPVSGGSEGAAAGTLSIMVGGEPEDVERVRPVLAAMGRVITHVGPVGAGQACKLVNQILVVVTMLAVGEALLFAQAQGLDLHRTLEAVSGGAAGSWMLSNRGPQVIARDFRPGFTIDLQQKDLRLVLEAADELGVPLPATAIVSQLYQALQRRGFGGEGNHALVRALEALAGFEIGGR